MNEEFVGPEELTVAKLKEALSKFPDDMVIHADGETAPDPADFGGILLSLVENPGSVSILFLTVCLSY